MIVSLNEMALSRNIKHTADHVDIDNIIETAIKHNCLMVIESDNKKYMYILHDPYKSVLFVNLVKQSSAYGNVINQHKRIIKFFYNDIRKIINNTSINEFISLLRLETQKMFNKLQVFLDDLSKYALDVMQTINDFNNDAVGGVTKNKDRKCFLANEGTLFDINNHSLKEYLGYITPTMIPRSQITVYNSYVTRELNDVFGTIGVDNTFKIGRMYLSNKYRKENVEDPLNELEDAVETLDDGVSFRKDSYNGYNFVTNIVINEFNYKITVIITPEVDTSNLLYSVTINS